MPWGITDNEYERLKLAFSHNPLISKVVLYGSRAKGNYKPFSDIDMTIVGDGLTRNDMNCLAGDIDELLLPYNIDLSLFASLRNQELIDHINRCGIVIYSRGERD